MKIQGLVSDVNEKMLTFQVEKLTFYMVHLFMENPEQKLPENGTQIRINSPLLNDNQFLVLLPETKVKGNFSVSTDLRENLFFKIVKENNLGPSEVTNIASNYENFKKHFGQSNDVSHEAIFINLLLKITGKESKFKLQFINQLRFVSEDPNDYKDFKYWTFGHHCSSSNKFCINYLIGYFFINSETGTLYFTDFKRQIPCIVTNTNDLSQFLDCYIFFSEYTFLTEIYNCDKPVVLEYLLINLSTVIKLDVYKKASKTPTQFHGYQRDLCRIIRKSVPMAVTSTQIHCWLQIIHENQGEIFLCLKSSFVEDFPVLKEGSTYFLYTKSYLTKMYNKEIYIINSSIPQKELGPNSFFIPTTSPTSFSNILDTSTAQARLADSHDIISFEGVISVKKFVNSLGSRTQKLREGPNFGTPGNKTHVLEFRAEGAVLSLYLNNWENLAVPYGLVPNMRVIVYNVKPQSRKYYKSTAMTRIEIVNFEVKARFDTANLCDPDWGTPYFLGAGSLVLNGTIIWTKVLSFFFLGLKIRTDQNLTSRIKLDVSITLLVKDTMGESKVFAKEEKALLLLKSLLGTQETVFEKWCQGIEILGHYNYHKGINMSEISERDEEKLQVIQYLNELFTSIDKIGLRPSLKCRKIEDDKPPIYYLLDVRNSYKL